MLSVDVLQLDVLSADPDSPAEGQVWFNTTLKDLRVFRDGLIQSVLTAQQHPELQQLIHFIDEGPAEGFASGATKTVTGGLFPTEILWKRSDDTALVRQTLTWSGILPVTVEWKVYAADGATALATVTDTISYAGIFETGRTRTIA
jgi:hypothetical protein